MMTIGPPRVERAGNAERDRTDNRPALAVRPGMREMTDLNIQHKMHSTMYTNA